MKFDSLSFLAIVLQMQINLPIECNAPFVAMQTVELSPNNTIHILWREKLSRNSSISIGKNDCFDCLSVELQLSHI